MVFECSKCGHCCKTDSISITYSDVNRWFNTKRDDILREVYWVDNLTVKGQGELYFVSTILNPKRPCIFLIEDNGTYLCSIHDTKPRVCRDFPIGHPNSGCPYCNDSSDPTNKIKDDQLSDFYLAYINRRKIMELLIKSRERTLWLG